MSLNESAALLVTLVERLLHQHRAGIVPSFGQIDSLAELTGLVRRELSNAGAPGTAGARR